MTAHTLIEPLECLLTQVQGLINLAREGSWEELDQESIRYNQAAVFLNDDAYIRALIDAGLVESAKFLIMQIQGLNDALDEEASLVRDQMASDLRQLNQAEKAMQAYGQ